MNIQQNHNTRKRMGAWQAQIFIDRKRELGVLHEIITKIMKNKLGRKTDNREKSEKKQIQREISDVSPPSG